MPNFYRIREGDIEFTISVRVALALLHLEGEERCVCVCWGGG